MTRQHPYLPTLVRLLDERRVDRREFLRTATLLGMSATAAYGIAGRALGGGEPAQAAESMPQGGTVRIGAIVHEIKDPHTFYRVEQSNIARQVCDYLTFIGHDNVTRPWLVERWQPSDDLKTWTLYLRKDVTWHDGRPFLADDVVWNFRRILDPKTGSSMVGQLKGYMLDEYETGEKDAKGNPKKSVRLWDANAIEKVDDHTVRLNGKRPHLAVPEDLFAYQFPIVDPADNGVFTTGANGTGGFELVEYAPGRHAVLKARNSYWAGKPHIDRLEFVDLGEDAAAGISALVSGQIQGLTSAGIAQYEVLQNRDDIAFYKAATASTAVVRGKHTVKPFDDVRVRKALQLGTDTAKLMAIAYKNLGDPGEFHHVAPIHPEYAPLPRIERDVAKAKALLAEAGYADGLELEMKSRSDPDWFVITVQALAQQWRDIGVTVKLSLMPASQYSELWNKTEFGVTDWFHRPLGVQTLSLAYRSNVPWNETGYANPEFDHLLDQAEATVDVEARRAIMAKLEKIMQDDAVAIQPFWRSVFTFFDARVKGFRMHPSQFIFGHQLAVEA